MVNDIDAEKQRIHDLIEQLGPRELSLVHGLLRILVDPVSPAAAVDPIGDAPESPSAVPSGAEAPAWFNHIPHGIAFDDVLADFGLTPADLEDCNRSEPEKV